MENARKIITRKEAKELGLTRYFTGKPCKHGHVSERQTDSGKCHECHRIRQSEQKEANAAAQARYRKRHPDKVRDGHRRWYQELSPERKAERNGQSTEIARNNPKRVEQRRLYSKENYANNKAYYKQAGHERIRKLRKQYLALTKEEQLLVDEFYKEMSRLNERDGANTWHVDHIIPLSKGGAHAPDNLQILSAKENRKKGAHIDNDQLSEGKRTS